jgi:hypothetical protein
MADFSDTRQHPLVPVDRGEQIHAWGQQARSQKGRDFVFSLEPHVSFSKILPLSELKRSTLREMMIPMFHDGLYLLTRSIVRPKRKFIISTLIKDLNSDAIRLNLTYFQQSLSEDPSRVIPSGTIIAIRNHSWVSHQNEIRL